MAIADTVKDIKPSQWALIAGAGLGLGLLLRMRSKAKAGTTVTTTDTPSTLNSTQGYGNFSGTGMTGWAGGAIINPGSTSPGPTTPVAVKTPDPAYNPGDWLMIQGTNTPSPVKLKTPYGVGYSVQDASSPTGWVFLKYPDNFTGGPANPQKFPIPAPV